MIFELLKIGGGGSAGKGVGSCEERLFCLPRLSGVELASGLAGVDGG